MRLVSKGLHARLSYKFKVCVAKLILIVSVGSRHVIEVHVPPRKLWPNVNLLIWINEAFKYF